MASRANEIGPDEVQINTPLRPCAVPPLAEETIAEIEKCFRDICGPNIAIDNVYKAQKKKVTSLSDEATLRRRGKTKAG